MAVTPISSRMSPPVETIVDRELDRARKDFMDLVRSTDRQVRRDESEGRRGARRDRDGRDQDDQPTAPRADEAARRARLQAGQQAGQQAARHPLASIMRDPAREAPLPREAQLPREAVAPTARRGAERAGQERASERSPVMRGGQDGPVVARRADAPGPEISRVAERRESPPPAPVAERQIDRRRPSETVAAAPAAMQRAARALDAASLVMPTAAGESLALVASPIGLPPSPWRLSSETPPEIARRIAHFMRTGELDRSPVTFAAPSPVAGPAQSEAPEDAQDAPQPKLLAPFAQAAAAPPRVPSLFGPHFERQLHPDRRSKAPAVPMQAAVLAATATALEAPHVGSDPEGNPFFDDYETKARDRRKRESQAVVEALRRREEG